MVTVKFEGQLVVNRKGEVIEGDLGEAGRFIIKFVLMCRKMNLTNKEFVELSKLVGFLQVVDNDPMEARGRDIVEAKKIRAKLEHAQNVLADKMYLDLVYGRDVNFNAKVTARAFLDRKTWANWRKLRKYF